MEFLERLLFCLMVNGISSNKYYYKRNGNGFDVIFGPHAIGDYKELKPPKSIKVNHDMRGERPGECIDEHFFCRIPYQRSMTQHFECNSDYQCPRFHKCCQLKCFLHKVCQPAFCADLPTTVRSTIHEETSASSGTEKTTTESITTQPPEPPPQVNLDTKTYGHPIKTTEVIFNKSFSLKPLESKKSDKITTRGPVTDIYPKITYSSTPTSEETREESSTELTAKLSSIRQSHIIELDNTEKGQENITKITSEEPPSRSTSTESMKPTAGITNEINEISSSEMTSERSSISKYFSNIETNTSIGAREQKSITITTRSPNVEHENITEITASPEIKDRTTTVIVINEIQSPTNIETNTSTESIKPTTGTINEAITTEVLSSATNMTSTTMKKIDPKSTEITTISPLVETETSSNTEISVSPIKRNKTSSIEPIKSTSSFTQSSETTKTSTSTEAGRPNTTEDTTGQPEPQTKSSVGTEINNTSESIEKTITENEPIDTGSTTEIISNKFSESDSTAQYETSSKTKQETYDEYATKYSTTLSSEYIQSSKVDNSTKNITTVSAEIQIEKSNKTETIGTFTKITSVNETSSHKTVTSKENKSTRETINFSTETSATIHINEAPPQLQGFPQNRTATTTKTQFSESSTHQSKLASEMSTTNYTFYTIKQVLASSQIPTKTLSVSSTSAALYDIELISEISTTTETLPDILTKVIGIQKSTSEILENVSTSVDSEKNDTKTTLSEDSEVTLSPKTENATTMAETSEDDEDIMGSGFGSGDGSGNDSEDDTEAGGGDKPHKGSELENAKTQADTFEDDEDMMESGSGSSDGSDDNTEATGSDKTNKTLQSSELLKNTAKNTTSSPKVSADTRNSLPTKKINETTTIAETSEDDEDMMGSGFGSGDSSGNGIEDNTEAGGRDKPEKNPQKGSEHHENAKARTDSFEDNEDMIGSGFGSDDGDNDDTEAKGSDKLNDNLQTLSELLKNTTENTTTSPLVEVETSADTRNSLPTKKINETTEMLSSELTQEVPLVKESSTTTMSTTIVGKDQKTSTNIESKTSTETPKSTTCFTDEEYGTITDQLTKIAIDEGKKLNISSTDPGAQSDKIIFRGSTNFTKTKGSDAPDKTPQTELKKYKNATSIVDSFVDDEDMMGSGFGSGDGSGDGIEDNEEAGGRDKTEKNHQEGSEHHENSKARTDSFEDNEDMIGSGFGSDDGDDDNTEAKGSEKVNENLQTLSELLKNTTENTTTTPIVKVETSADTRNSLPTKKIDEKTEMLSSELTQEVPLVKESSTTTMSTTILRKDQKTSTNIESKTSIETTKSTTSFTDEEYGTKTDQFTKIAIDEGRKLNISSTYPGAQSDKIIFTGSTNFTKAKDSDEPDKTSQKELEKHKKATSIVDSFEDDEDMMGSGFGSGDGSGNGIDDNAEAGGRDKPEKNPQEGLEHHENAKARTDSFEDIEDMIGSGFGSDDGDDDNTEEKGSDKLNENLQTLSELLKNTTEITTTSPKVEVETSANAKNSSPKKIGDKTTTEMSTNQTQSLTTNKKNTKNTLGESVKQTANNNETTVETTEILLVKESYANTTSSPNVEHEILVVTETSASSKIKDGIITDLVTDKIQLPTSVKINKSTEFVKPTSEIIYETTETSSSQLTQEVTLVEESSATTMKSTLIVVKNQTTSTNFESKTSTETTESTGSDKPDKTPQNGLEIHKNATSTTDTFEDDEDMMGSGFGSGDGSGNGSEDNTEAVSSDKPGRTPQKGWELLKNSTRVEDEVMI